MLNFSVLLSAVTCTFEGEQSCCVGRSGSLECVESGVCIYQVPCFSFMRTQTAIICDCDCKVMQKFWMISKAGCTIYIKQVNLQPVHVHTCGRLFHDLIRRTASLTADYIDVSRLQSVV